MDVMPATTTPWTVTAPPLPSGLDHPDAWAVRGCADVSRAVDEVVYGHPDLAYTPRNVLTWLANQAYSTRRLLVVTDGTHPDGPHPDAVLGTALLTLPRQGNEHLAYVELRVRPGARRRGVGTALVRAAEDEVRAAGRTTVIAHSEHGGEPRPDDPDVLEPPTGSGRLSRREPAVGFAAHHGYRLEQTERYSRLDLPVDPGLLDRLATDAAEKAAGYRLVAWQDRAPDEHVDDYAYLATRMSTDVPTADLDIEEDPWDAERIRVAEQETADRGHRTVVVAAQHVATGRLVGYTEVELPEDKPHVVFQEDTLVLREHRGRRLGMLMKVEALRRLRAVRPAATAVHTWNAEENAHMLGINVALGYRPAGVTAMWQKRLDA